MRLKIEIPPAGLVLLRDIVNEQPAEEEWTIPGAAEALMQIGAISYLEVEKMQGKSPSLKRLVETAKRTAEQQIEIIFLERYQ